MVVTKIIGVTNRDGKYGYAEEDDGEDFNVSIT
jgi:hypothetical protein